eukprot:TRINITY_DN12898_c0_g1_i1.p1 TRINITY_DN12898_c0_g1~~TRINITY_DN12898_c0_g1_i1.p1  ORF type:complete len:403 (-),score=71.32 TRINITY_DN12898_c0_g1_i1:44-1252(-)
MNRSFAGRNDAFAQDQPTEVIIIRKRQRRNSERSKENRSKKGKLSNSGSKNHFSASPNLTPSQLECRDTEFKLSMVTFNILAPCYNKGEDKNTLKWETRNNQILNMVKSIRERKEGDVICFQEFWLKPQFLNMYKQYFKNEKFSYITLARDRVRKPEGLAIFYDSSKFELLDKQEIKFHDWNYRVALLSLFKLKSSPDHIFIVVNTHLTFPNCSADVELRQAQIVKLIYYIKLYIYFKNLSKINILVAGDFNGDENDEIYKVLTNDQFCSTFKTVHHHEAGVTHFNHRHESVGVDYIWNKHCTRDEIIKELFEERNGKTKLKLDVERNLTCKKKLRKWLGCYFDLTCLGEITDETREEVWSDWTWEVEESELLPRGLADNVWPTSFNMSDHRPVVTNLRIKQ